MEVEEDKENEANRKKEEEETGEEEKKEGEENECVVRVSLKPTPPAVQLQFSTFPPLTPEDEAKVKMVDLHKMGRSHKTLPVAPDGECSKLNRTFCQETLCTW